MKQSVTKALIAELVGTFALIFVGAGAAALGVGGLVGVALAHGLVVLGLVYAYGHISGAHVNPAVTVGVWAAGKMDTGRALSYIVFQLVGGILGAFALRTVLGGPETGLGATVLAQNLRVGGATISITPTTGFLVEAILTFFLANCVLHAAVAGKAGELAGVAIGLTWAACILLGGSLTGASLNPARTLGPAVATGNFADLWVYLAGPLAGAVVAALLYRGVLATE